MIFRFCPFSVIILVDLPAAPDDLPLLPLLRHHPLALARGRCAEAADVLALDDVLLELPELLRQHRVLALLHAHSARVPAKRGLQRLLLTREALVQVLDLALEQLRL